MRVIPLAAYLDRGNVGGAAAPLEAPAIARATREEEIAEARRDGERLGHEAARQAHEEELQKQRQAFDERLAEERRAWAETEGRELAKALGGGLARIEAAIADVTARLLEPLIVAEARRTTLAELKELLGEMLTKPEVATIRVMAPEDLLVVLRDSLGQSGNVVFTASADPDIHVETGNTVIETRLVPWAARLREAMA